MRRPSVGLMSYKIWMSADKRSARARERWPCACAFVHMCICAYVHVQKRVLSKECTRGASRRLDSQPPAPSGAGHADVRLYVDSYHRSKFSQSFPLLGFAICDLRISRIVHVAYSRAVCLIEPTLVSVRIERLSRR